MKVLILARSRNGRFAPFIIEQVAALRESGVDCQFFGIAQQGVWGYLRYYPQLRKIIRSFHPDIVHAHYGLCGVLANLQRIVPVVTTYHGSDINNPKIRWLSRFAISLSRYNIFVSQNNVDSVYPQKNYALIPCGINLDDYPFVDKIDARAEIGLSLDRKYVLFAGAFDNPVKNAVLAKEVVALLPEVELLELKGYSRQQVALLMQAVDAFLMTSFTEGSPQVIKEAMACGCPIVSVDVGDVRERIDGIDGCYVAQTRDPALLADLLKKAISFQGRTKGKEAVLSAGLSNEIIAEKLKAIYESVAKKDN